MSENKKNDLGKDKSKKKNKKNAEAEEIINPCTKCAKHNCMDGEDYCEECLIKMLNTRITFAGWLAGAVSLVLSVVAVVLVIMHVPCVALSIRAESAARDNRWMDACYYYNQMEQTVLDLKATFNWETDKEEPVLRRFFMMGTNTKAKMFESYAKMYGPLVAVENLLTKDYTTYDAMVKGESKLIEHKLVKPYWEMYDSVTYTQSALIYAEEQPEEDTYESSIKFIDSFKNRTDIDSVYLAYQKYVTADYYNQSCEERIKWLNECEKLAEASGKDYKWMYYYDYADVLNEQGKVDEAIAKIDLLISENQNNFNAYTQKCDILLTNGRVAEAEKFVGELNEKHGNYTETKAMQLKIYRYKGEYDKALVLGEDMLKNYEGSPEVYRQISLIYLAQGDYRSAFEHIDIGYTNAYNMNYYNAGISEEDLVKTLYVCAKLFEANEKLSDSEKATMANINEMFGTEYEPNAEMKAIVSGEKTAKEILTQGDYDLV